MYNGRGARKASARGGGRCQGGVRSGRLWDCVPMPLWHGLCGAQAGMMQTAQPAKCTVSRANAQRRLRHHHQHCTRLTEPKGNNHANTRAAQAMPTRRACCCFIPAALQPARWRKMDFCVEALSAARQPNRLPPLLVALVAPHPYHGLPSACAPAQSASGMRCAARASPCRAGW